MKQTQQEARTMEEEDNELLQPAVALFREFDFFQQNRLLKMLLQVHGAEAEAFPKRMMSELHTAMQDISGSASGQQRTSDRMYCEHCDDNFNEDAVVYDKKSNPICPNCKSALIVQPAKSKRQTAGRGHQTGKQRGNQTGGQQGKITLREAIHKVLKPGMTIADVEKAVFDKTNYQSKAEQPHVLISKNLSVMAQAGEIIQDGGGTYSPLAEGAQHAHAGGRQSGSQRGSRQIQRK